MDLNDVPSYMEIPITMGHVKAFFYFNENLLLEKYTSSNPHNHPDFEMHYIASGKDFHIAGHNEFLTQKGDMVVLHPNEYHFQRMGDSRENFSQYCVRFAIKPPTSNATPQQKKAYTDIIKLLDSIDILHDDTLSALPIFQTIKREISEKKNGYFHALQALCLMIFTIMCRLAGANQTVFPAENLKNISYWRNRIEYFLHHRYMDNVKIKDLADAIKMSQRQTSRLLLREYGVNFVTKLTEARIMQAAYQLEYTDKSIEEISSACGFSNYSYFSTCFRKIIGIPPSEFRKQKRRNL